ncbi:TonB-dependent receptor plug domain-containing protein [Croceitalea sp. P059]|uniref:TonB-dependent receptor plug domain-containing protein n=1 Tax=Croceitalea sp. P059 TaxID=3075601 RepID=UPI002887C3AA|nr:TonB-dependent receptor plug domain-containing protein [Croceitalea sp. P059]MDT0539743.1 TonB-dependent receptor plug domain-containing protein [Croceitalea sp. P059]
MATITNPKVRLQIFRSYVLFLTLCLSFMGVAQAQDVEKNEKFADRLERLKERFGVDFSYNYSVLGQIEIPKSSDCTTLETCLKELNEFIPITFEASSTSNYMVLPIRNDLKFTIIDAITDEAINGINVQINNGIERYYYPKKEGYVLENIFALDSIHIHAPYYKSVHIKASDLQQMKGPLKFEQEMIHLDEVEIIDYLTRGIDSKISDNSIQVDMNSLGLLAGETDGDIFNVIKNIPGVHSPSGKPGSLNFRGSTFDQSLIQIDDIPIYHNGHFFGALSPYNPLFIDKIEIQRNTLSAKWGGRVGGLINMTTSSIIADSTSYAFQANSVYAGATIKIPVVKDKLAFYFAGRSNYPGINSPKLTAFSNLNFQGSRLEVIADDVNSEKFEVGFYDINSKLIYDINNNHKATVSYINIQNSLFATLKDSDSKQEDFRDLDLDNWGVTAKWEGKFSERFTAQARFSKSSLTIDNTSEGFLETERNSFEKYTNTIDDTRFIVEADFEVNTTTKLETGYTLTDYELGFDERNDQNSVNNRRDQNATVHSAFFSLNKNWGDKVTANIGLHSDYYNPNQRLYADPRIMVNFRFNESLFFKTSAGRSHQFIQKKLRDDFDDFNNNSQFWFLPDRTTAVLEGYQAMVGVLYEKSGWLLDTEFYLRNTDKITLQDNTEMLQTGELKTLGVDLFIKKKWHNIETIFSYSLSSINTNYGETSPVYFDQRHILNFTGLWHLDPFNFAFTWGYFSGMPVVIPDFDEGNDSLADLELLNSERFPNQHQLDISATYSFSNEANTWKGIVGLSFINLYNQDNIVNLFQNAPSPNSPYRKAITFSPNVQLSIFF